MIKPIISEGSFFSGAFAYFFFSKKYSKNLLTFTGKYSIITFVAKRTSFVGRLPSGNLEGCPSGLRS